MLIFLQYILHKFVHYSDIVHCSRVHFISASPWTITSRQININTDVMTRSLAQRTHKVTNFGNTGGRKRAKQAEIISAS